jgi:fatty acid desaturase
MNDSSRNQGWAIVGGAGFLGLLFLAGLLNGSYWALAIPVATLVFFVLALVAWVGHTIATVQVEAEPATEETSEPASEPESLRDASGS